MPGIDRPIRELDCDDLILFKLVSGRAIDRADAAMLLRENREAINFTHLGKWVARLSLSGGFCEIWQNAFPGESMPKILG